MRCFKFLYKLETETIKATSESRIRHPIQQIMTNSDLAN